MLLGHTVSNFSEALDTKEETERNFLLMGIAYAANIGGTGVITGRQGYIFTGKGEDTDSDPTLTKLGSGLKPGYVWSRIMFPH